MRDDTEETVGKTEAKARRGASNRCYHEGMVYSMAERMAELMAKGAAESKGTA